MKRDKTKELGRACICMEPWILDGAYLLRSLGLFCKYRGIANIIQGITKSSDLSVRCVAWGDKGANCIFQ